VGLECRPNEADGDADLDGDGDGDIQADADADGDSDVDGDTDGDSDVDGDSDGDWDGDSVTDGDSDVDSDADGDTDADSDVDGDADGDSDGDSDGDADGDADADCDAEADGDIEVVCDPLPEDCDIGVPCPGTMTIQEAVDTATEGARICVFPGTYRERLSFDGSSVRILGLGGASVTTIDGEGTGPVVSFRDGDGSHFEGFTVTGGVAESGGGIFVEESSPTLMKLVVAENEATLGGGGLYYIDAPGGSLTHSKIHNNRVASEDGSSGLGGGMKVHRSRPILRNLVFSENASDGSAGGLAITDSVMTGETKLSHALFHENVATHHHGHAGALLIGAGTVIEVSNVIMEGNEARDIGGGIAVAWGSTLTLVNATLVENRASLAGAGLRCRGGSTIFLINVNVSGGALGERGIVCDIGEFDAAFLHCNVHGFGEDNYSGDLDDPTSSDGNISVEPSFLRIGRFERHPWDVHLVPDTDLVGAGSALYPNPDSEDSDIGAYGGPEAHLWDLDGDGYFQPWRPGASLDESHDCNDFDPNVH